MSVAVCVLILCVQKDNKDKQGQTGITHSFCVQVSEYKNGHMDRHTVQYLQYIQGAGLACDCAISLHVRSNCQVIVQELTLTFCKQCSVASARGGKFN